MKKSSQIKGTIGALFMFGLLAAVPVSASAFWDGFPFGSPDHKPSTPKEVKLPFNFCDRTIQAAGISIKVSMPSKKCDTTPPPPEEEDVTLDFSADPTTIDEGESATLEWSSDNADSCTASNGWNGDKAFDGSQSVSPATTTTYTLTCENDSGDVHKSVTVTVIPAEPAPDAPTLDFIADPITIEQGSSTTLEWESFNADTCEASDGWSGSKTLAGSQVVSPSATTTYTLTCEGEGGDVEESVVVGVTVPHEEPVEGAFLITEVMYDLATTGSQGTESANEWVELHNDTNSAINLSDYFIADSTGSDALPNVELPAGAYAVVTSSSTTATYWDFPENAVIIVLANNIGSNGLGNAGDAVFLYDAASSTVDSVSWGTNVDAFDPAVEGVEDNSGHSIARTDVTVDTDTAADWEERNTPTPGE